MKRGKKLFLLLAVLVVLALCVWAVTAFLPKEAEEEQAEEKVERTLFSLEPASVTKLSWSYQGEVMEFTRSGDNWVYTTDHDFPTAPSAINKMVETLADIREERNLGVQEDLEQYGLGETAVVVKVTTDQTYTVIFGNNVKYGSSSYMMLEDGNVYLVDHMVPKVFRKTLTDVIEEETLPDLKGTELANAGLSLATCAAFLMDDSELVPFGLHEPQTVSVTCKDGTELTLDFAVGEDTYYYVRLKDSRLVYEITESAYNNLVKLTETEE